MSAKVITISNQIGGTGKTTLAYNISHILADMGFRVLVADLDPRAFLTHYFDIDEKNLPYSMKELLVKSTVFWKTTLFIKNNLYLIPASDELLGMDYHLIGKPFSYLQLSKKLEPAKKEHDFIIIDTPSYFNLFTVNAWNFSDIILAPFLPEPSGIEGLVRLLKSINGLPVGLNLLLNRTKKINKYEEYFLETFNQLKPENASYIGEIPDSDIVLESLFKRKPLTEIFSDEKITKSFEKIAEIMSVKV